MCILFKYLKKNLICIFVYRFCYVWLSFNKEFIEVYSDYWVFIISVFIWDIFFYYI